MGSAMKPSTKQRSAPSPSNKPPKEMILWVVYSGMSDNPAPFLVRRWVISDAGVVPDQNAHTASSLNEVRKAIPRGFVNIGRQPNDDRVIVEVWI